MEGSVFEIRQDEWIFFNLPNLCGRIRPWCSLSPYQKLVPETGVEHGGCLGQPYRYLEPNIYTIWDP
jgi:hypothetical protein